MRRILSDVQDGFAGGLNLTGDESQLAPNEIRQAINARLTWQGGLKKRRGSKKLHSSALAASVLGGFSWNRSSSTTQLVVANGDLHTGTYSVGMSWTNQGGTMSTSQPPVFAAFRDGTGECVYIADGGGLNKWTAAGALTENIASTPNVIAVWVYNRRLFGITGDSDILYWSALDNGDSLGIAASGGGSANIRTFGAQRLIAGGATPIGNLLGHITGISVFEGWTQDDISVASGTNGYSMDTGMAGQRSLVNIEGALLFASERGIYQATAGGAQPVSQKIDNIFTSLSTTELQSVIGVHNRAHHEVWFYVPSYGVFVFNYRIRAWSGPFNGAMLTGLTAMWPAQNSDGEPIVLAGDSDGFVKHVDMEGIGLDNVLSDGTGGSTVTMDVQLHRMFFGDPSETKSLRWAFLAANLNSSTGMTFEWFTSTASGTFSPDTSGGALWGTGEWGTGIWGTGGLEVFRIPVHGTGPYADISVTDTGTKELLLSRLQLQAFGLGQR
jgi:hypothetical protein